MRGERTRLQSYSYSEAGSDVFRPGDVVDLARVNLGLEVEDAGEGVAATYTYEDLGVRIAAVLDVEQARQGAEERVAGLEEELCGHLQLERGRLVEGDGDVEAGVDAGEGGDVNADGSARGER